jgi:hypothetical protein
LLLVRENMTITFSLHLGLMPQELVNHSLVDPFRGQVRGEGMSEDLKTSHPNPFTSFQAPAEPFRRERLLQDVVGPEAEGIHAARMPCEPLLYDLRQ